MQVRQSQRWEMDKLFPRLNDSNFWMYARFKEAKTVSAGERWLEVIRRNTDAPGLKYPKGLLPPGDRWGRGNEPWQLPEVRPAPRAAPRPSPSGSAAAWIRYLTH